MLRAWLDKILIVWHYGRCRHGWPPRTVAALRRRQQRQLRRCLRRAARHYAYYRPWAGRPLAEWPVLDKAEYLAHFAELNAPGLTLAACRAMAQAAEASRDFRPQLPGGLSVGLSSGTSGQQGVFVLSRGERLAWAGAMLAKALPHGLLGPPHRIALFLRANNALYETVGSRQVRFGYFDLTRPLPALRAELAAFQPTVLVAPAYVLRLLAEAETQQPLGIRPARIFAAAEVLEPTDQAVIAQAFAQPVHQIYQAAEGFLGISCAHGRLHLNEDLLLVEREYLDAASGRFTPIITDFTRRTQAIIRYRLADVLVEAAAPCACGSPHLALERVEGRCDDVLVLAAATDGRPVPVFPDFVRNAVLQSSAHVADFRCEQTTPACLTLHLATHGGELAATQAAVAQALAALWAQHGAVPPQLTFATLATTDPALHLKRRRVRRAFAVPPAALTVAAG